jgi:hypothetical protein
VRSSTIVSQLVVKYLRFRIHDVRYIESLARPGNKVYLNADSLLLNLLRDADDKFAMSVQQKKKVMGLRIP